jgi:small-conductance mechanosensitive channel
MLMTRPGSFAPPQRRPNPFWRARCARFPAAIGFLAAIPAHAAPADAAMAQESSRVGPMVDALARVAGDWAHQPALAGITWGQVVLAGITLVLVAGTIQVLRWILRRVARKHDLPAGAASGVEPDRTPWLKLTLEALIPPLTVFLWVWGVYAAIVLVFARVDQGRDWSLALRVVAWAQNAGEIVALFWFFFRMIRVVDVELHRLTAKTRSKWDDVLVAIVVRALRLLVPLAGVILIVPALNLPAASHEFLKQAASLLLIGAVGFIVYQMVNAVEQAVLGQFRIDVKDNLEARKIYTQVKVLKKIAVVVIVLFTTASMLMVFDSVRRFGTSLLASAGVVGIIVGFAAQRSIATVLAGFQIAMTQPIRLDDVVIVENEWGRIEEITLTYVVVLIWDLRRLVVPINYFIEKPFQNWTRVSADLLGSVFLYVDYTVPLQALRDELDRLLEKSSRWDRKVKVVQVTDAKPTVMEVRVLVSAADAGTAWDLRCELREKLIDFIQRNYPQCLPRTRAELAGDRLPDPARANAPPAALPR